MPSGAPSTSLNGSRTSPPSFSTASAVARGPEPPRPDAPGTRGRAPSYEGRSRRAPTSSRWRRGEATRSPTGCGPSASSRPLDDGVLETLRAAERVEFAGEAQRSVVAVAWVARSSPNDPEASQRRGSDRIRRGQIESYAGWHRRATGGRYSTGRLQAPVQRACLGPSLVHREHLLTAVVEVRRRRVAAIAAPSQQALQDVVRLLRAAIRKQLA